MRPVTVFATAAAADEPLKTQFSLTRGGIIVDVCPFDIDYHAVFDVTGTRCVDRRGVMTEHFHIIEQDTFTGPSGKSLTGVPFTFNARWLYDSDGNLIHLYADGIVEKVPLPDGGLFITARRIDSAAQGFPEFILTPDNGATVNLDRFCAALEP